MNQYEIAVVFDPGLEIDLGKATERVEKIIKDAGGTIVATENWGKRKLAYQIKKHESGIYVFWKVQLPAQNVGKIENALNLTDEVIRFLISRPDLVAIAKAEAERAEKAKRAAEHGDKPEDAPETEE